MFMPDLGPGTCFSLSISTCFNIYLYILQILLTYPSSVQSDDPSFDSSAKILDDIPIISTSPNATSFNYNGTKWYFIEPNCTQLHCQNLTYDFGRKSLDPNLSRNQTVEKRSVLSNEGKLSTRFGKPYGLGKRAAQSDDEQSTDQPDDTGASNQSGDTSQDDVPQQDPAQVQPPVENRRRPPWADLQIPREVFTLRYLESRRTIQPSPEEQAQQAQGNQPEQSRPRLSQYAFYRAVEGTNRARVEPTLFLWLWKGPVWRDMLHRDIIWAFIKNFPDYYIHEIVSPALIYLFTLNTVGSGGVEEIWPYMLDHKEMVRRILGDGSRNGYNVDEYIAELRDSLILEGQLVWNRVDLDLGVDDGERERELVEQSPELKDRYKEEFDWKRFTRSEAVSVREVMIETRDAFRQIIWEFINQALENFDFDAEGIWNGCEDGATGYEIALHGITAALEAKNTRWRDSKDTDIIIREDVSPAKPMRLREGVVHEYADDDSDEEPRPPLHSHRRPGEGTSKDPGNDDSEQNEEQELRLPHGNRPLPGQGMSRDSVDDGSEQRPKKRPRPSDEPPHP